MDWPFHPAWKNVFDLDSSIFRIPSGKMLAIMRRNWYRECLMLIQPNDCPSIKLCEINGLLWVSFFPPQTIRSVQFNVLNHVFGLFYSNIQQYHKLHCTLVACWKKEKTFGLKCKKKWHVHWLPWELIMIRLVHRFTFAYSAYLTNFLNFFPSFSA